MIVIMMSLAARPKILAAWTPLPGSPRRFAYGQGMCISIKVFRKNFIDACLYIGVKFYALKSLGLKQLGFPEPFGLRKSYVIQFLLE